MKLSKTQLAILKRLAGGDALEYHEGHSWHGVRFSSLWNVAKCIRMSTFNSLIRNRLIKNDQGNIYRISDAGRSAIEQMENE
jgi:uncharacterized protein YjhX (UPF0386 family)